MQKHEFVDNFEQNQELISGLMPDKRIQNTVAGYITKKVKSRTKKLNSKQGG